jgi:hypothetical protein
METDGKKLHVVRLIKGRAMAKAVSRRPPPRRPGFDPGSVYVEFVVDKVALGQVFPAYFGFQYQFHSTGVPLLGKIKKNTFSSSSS